MLHMAGIALSSGTSMPSVAVLNRESYYRMCEAYEKKRLWQIKKELERQELMTIKEKGDEIIINLTDKGKMKALKEAILKPADKLPDGMVCLVSFDIPENIKASRQVLRLFLKKANFKQEHLSVWKSDNDVLEPLHTLINDLKINKWVKVYTAFEKKY